MEYTQLIHEFLEGTIDKSGEENLFLSLSTNEELRNEMKQAIALDKAFSKRISAFVPTSASTIGIFQQLGIGTAAGVAGAALAGKSALSTFFSTYSQAIISGIATLAVSTGLFLGLHTLEKSTVQSNNTAKSLNNVSNNSKIDNNQNNNSVNPAIPSVSSNEVQSTKVRTVIKYIYITKDANAPSDLSNNMVSSDNSPVINKVTKSDLVYNELPKGFILNHSNNLASIDNSNYNPISTHISTYNDIGLSLEVKGNGSWSTPRSTLPIYSNPFLNNIGIGLNYHLSDQFALGVDFRQENYYQVFTGTNELDDKYEYKQNPNYLSLGMYLRYSFYQANGFTTYGQAQVGGTVTGLVTRGMLGIQYSPYKDISFILGGEYSILNYKHQNNWFSSSKMGIIYGIGFNF